MDWSEAEEPSSAPCDVHLKSPTFSFQTLGTTFLKRGLHVVSCFTCLQGILKSESNLAPHSGCTRAVPRAVDGHLAKMLPSHPACTICTAEETKEIM